MLAGARAWQLVGARDTSLLSTVAEVAQRQGNQSTHLDEGGQTANAGPAPNGDDGPT